VAMRKLKQSQFLTANGRETISYWFITSQASEAECDPWPGIDDTFAAITAVKITTEAPVEIHCQKRST
jgi:hypothetical protein